MSNVTRTEFKGHPVLDFGDHDRWPTRLGIGKLRAVVQNIDEVLRFLSDEGERDVVERYHEKRQAVAQLQSYRAEANGEVVSE